MNGLIDWITDRVARLLPHEDRAAALGDLQENGIFGRRALRELSGLVLLQQAQLWTNWRPWVALIGIAGIAGAVLGRILFAFSVAAGQEIRTYSHYRVFMDDATAGEVAVRLSLMLLATFTCSWIVAYVLGRVFRPVLWLTGPVLYLMVLESFPAWLLYTGHVRDSRNPIGMVILGALLPFNIPAIVGFLLPAIMGLRRGLQRSSA